MAETPEFYEIGQRLKAVRTSFSEDSQTAWAERHGFPLSRWNNWEKGTRRIMVDEAERLCDLYGLDLDWIYRGKLDGLSDSARKVLSSTRPM